LTVHLLILSMATNARKRRMSRISILSKQLSAHDAAHGQEIPSHHEADTGL
jgi:hypothetical protein